MGEATNMPMHVSAQEALSIAYSRWPGLILRQSGREGTELHGPCPITIGCAENDGFFISLLPQFNGLYQCRKCGAKGWLDDDQPYHRDAAGVADWEERRRAKEEDDARVLAAWQAGFKAGTITAYHEWLLRVEPAKNWLVNEGVNEVSIERYDLGFTPKKKVADGSEYPAFIFPIRNPWTGDLVNVNWRLLNAPPEYGKYRFVKNLPQASFFANRVLEGQAVVTEGTKKGIVVNQEFDAESGQSDIGVVAWPSNVPPGRLVKELECYEKGVTLFLDPGSEKALERLSREFSKTSLKGRVKYVTRPVKIDDAIVRYGITASDIRYSMKYQAREL